ncbi:hypothetical protein DN402_20120 [Streptomyces sp. SW4]|nr:hypothetical protein DN402_20120 [Streptomyces sp. SW4]
MTTVVPEVLAVLTLPDPESLTDAQRRGAVCLWGSERLTAETAVDLGEHTGPIGRWWPRACREHASQRAQRALLDHAPACDDCRGPAECEVTLALYRLIRAGWER